MTLLVSDGQPRRLLPTSVGRQKGLEVRVRDPNQSVDPMHYKESLGDPTPNSASRHFKERSDLFGRIKPNRRFPLVGLHLCACVLLTRRFTSCGGRRPHRGDQSARKLHLAGRRVCPRISSSVRCVPTSGRMDGNEAKYFLKSSSRIRVLRPRLTARNRPVRIS